MSERHGYGPYTRGCRCDVCRKAKADYMRKRRAAGRALAQQHSERAPGCDQGHPWKPGTVRYVAPIARHGSRFAYDELGCRCLDCTHARTSSDKLRDARRRARSAAS